MFNSIINPMHFFQKMFFKLKPISLVTGITFLAWLFYVQKSNWVAIYTLAWGVGVLGVCLSSHLTLGGLLLTHSTIILSLAAKSASLLVCSCTQKLTHIYVVGRVGVIGAGKFLSLSYSLDTYSLMFIFLTTTIGFFALFISAVYMGGEPRITTFIHLLYFFLISMVLLLAAGNISTLVLGWELIGCFSFFLINFWTSRAGTLKSSFKAFTFNKLSDFCLLLFFLSLWVYSPELLHCSFSSLYLLDSCQISMLGLQITLLDYMGLAAIICSFCKSAQFGFHVWLPDSMEAPVPASALIHSATLVSAGIFLIGRFDVIFLTKWGSYFITLWCSFTALYGGLVASYQTDLKRILAYSTISHCGFMFILTIYGNMYLLYIYLHLHGWFKSYSFMASGNIINNNKGYQDMRRFEATHCLTQLESLVLCTAICNLGGVPFLIGFFNKHYLLLELGHFTSLGAYTFLYAAAFTGLFYSQKIIKYVLSGVASKSTSHRTPLVNGLACGELGSGSTSFLSRGVFSVYTAVVALSSVTLLYLLGNEGSLIVMGDSAPTTFVYLYVLTFVSFYRAYLAQPLLALLLVKLVYAFV